MDRWPASRRVLHGRRLHCRKNPHMSSDNASLPAFRQLLETAASLSDPGRAVLLTDSLMGPTAGALLRRCAIPHEFDRALLRHLGDLDEAKTSEYYAQFAEL